MTNGIYIYIMLTVRWISWCLEFFFLNRTCFCFAAICFFYKLKSELAVFSFNAFTQEQIVYLLFIKQEKVNKYICVY